MERVSAATLRWWDWRLSGHFRLLSLSSVWALVFFGALAGPLLPLLGLFRMVFGTAQLGLNHILARNSPLAGRDRADWALLGLALAGSMTAAALAQANGSHAPVFFLPVLLPYTALQLRTFRRSIEAHREPLAMPIRLEEPLERAA